MQRRALPFRKTETDNLPILLLETAAQGCFLSGEIAQHSPATLSKHRLMVSKLVWFLKHKKLTECSVMELRVFFAYLSDEKPISGGRWGNSRKCLPVKASTFATCHAMIRALFAWLVAEGEIEASSRCEAVAAEARRQAETRA